MQTERKLELDHLGDWRRTHHCGELRPSHAGQKVFLAGWVDRRRDLGHLIFLDLRDHTGIVQVVLNPELSPSAHDKGEQVRSEYVVGVEGEVVVRAEQTVNPQIPTGQVEVQARQLLLLNDAKTPPFPLDDGARPSEESRLRYRYVDLRRARMQRNLRLRHQAALLVRRHMSEHGFIEIETPFLTRSTPEGARDYLVPSRLRPGHFYALPQSPQLFKQLLMIGGFDRYFQIVRCFRDEDLRADRQPEFTQIDVEMAFPQREELFEIIERLMQKLFALVDARMELPVPRLTYAEAMERYGSDKPHTGFGLEWARLTLPAAACQALKADPSAKALRVPAAEPLSRSQLDQLQDWAQASGAGWFSYIKNEPNGFRSPLTKPLGEAPVASLARAAGLQPGEILLLIGSKGETASSLKARQLDEASGALRLRLIERLRLAPRAPWNFVWVVDFPMFEYDEKENRFVAMHHPFTSPREEDLPKLESDPAAVKARAYDLVLNGQEIGGGSIRLHRRDIQARVFRVLGLSEEMARERFGFLMDALESGAPPHGGIALGWDRIVALMAGESNIREVIAFPKTASAVDLMCDAPATVDPEQLDELGIQIKQD